MMTVNELAETLLKLHELGVQRAALQRELDKLEVQSRELRAGMRGKPLIEGGSARVYQVGDHVFNVRWPHRSDVEVEVINIAVLPAVLPAPSGVAPIGAVSNPDETEVH